jgi:hypothetical protein
MMDSERVAPPLSRPAGPTISFGWRNRGDAVIRREQVADALVSMRSDAVVAADRDGIIRLWNPGA